MIKLINARVYNDEYSSLDELVSVTNERMIEYANKHPDFSCIIEKYPDENYLIIKTCKLEESSN